MGQAKRRKERNQDSYGSPADSNRRNIRRITKVRKSDISGKWAVDIDLPSGSRRLTVYVDKSNADAEIDFVVNAFGKYPIAELAMEENWQKAFSEYVAIAPADDDETLAVYKPQEDGTMLIDARRGTLDQMNAQMREHGILSDAIWNRGRS